MTAVFILGFVPCDQQWNINGFSLIIEESVRHVMEAGALWYL